MKLKLDAIQVYCICEGIWLINGGPQIQELCIVPIILARDTKLCDQHKLNLFSYKKKATMTNWSLNDYNKN